MNDLVIKREDVDRLKEIIQSASYDDDVLEKIYKKYPDLRL
jgi:hypothetical protein